MRRFQFILLSMSAVHTTTLAQVQWAESFRNAHIPAGGVATFDSVRGRTILFGGTDAGGTPLNETWEWDGAVWTRRTPSTNPPAGGAIAFDSGRGRAVYVVGDTWEWDGTDWTRIAVPAVPAGRLTYDSVRGRTVLLAATNNNGIANLSAWEYDGVSWVGPFTDPRSAFLYQYSLGTQATFDPTRGQTVLFAPSLVNPFQTTIWEWDGLSWRQRLTLSFFTVLGYPGGAFFDSFRARTVVAGVLNTQLHGLEWDGTVATSSPVLDSVSPWASVAAAFDSWRGTRVFVGNLGTWESDSVSWTMRYAGGYPRNRRDAAITFHAALGLTVLFGGGSPTADTWVWDGSVWTQRFSAITPPARTGHAMAYDSRRARTVLFGGVGVTPDTWEWDGTWALRQPVNRPPARQATALAYDEARGRTVLFGGYGVSGPLADTWEWDGADWSLMSPTVTPPPNFGHSMAYDSARRRIMLNSGGTWGWDGTNWTRFEPQTSPPDIRPSVMAHDSARQRVVLFQTSLLVPETWEWDGTDWAHRFPSSPVPLQNGAVAYDSRRGRCVYYYYFGPTPSEYFAPCDVIGRGHPSGGLSLSCITTPRIGSRFTLSYPNQPVGAECYLVLGSPRAAPLVLVAPTLCDTIFVWPEVTYVRSTRESPASFDFDIPPDAYLIGFSLWTQGASPEVSPSVCWRATDGLAFTIQP